MDRCVPFVQRDLGLNSDERGPGQDKSKHVRGVKKTAVPLDRVHLISEDSLAAVVSQDHEVPNRPMSGVEILIQASGEIVGLQNQQDDAWNMA